MIKVLIKTSPLGNENAIRGVGVYTRFLIESLQKRNDVKVITSESEITSATKPDLIHYPFFDLFFDTLPWWHRQPVVVTIHDVIPLIFPKYYRPGIKGYLRFLKQRSALHHVKQIITDSQTSQQDIHRLLRVNSQRIQEVPLAPNPLLCQPKPAQLIAVKKKFNLPEKYMLYVGDINYNKNLPQLIKALKFLPPEMKLVCVGKNFYEHDIPEWRWIETQIALSDVADRIKFIPDLNRQDVDDLAGIYHSALVYVQPSLYEGFGLPILEAMACQTPVIASHNSSLIEVGGEAVIYTDPTAESIAAQVTEVLNWTSVKRSLMIKAALKWSHNFTWDKVAAQTVKVYLKAINHD